MKTWRPSSKNCGRRARRRSSERWRLARARSADRAGFWAKAALGTPVSRTPVTPSSCVHPLTSVDLSVRFHNSYKDERRGKLRNLTMSVVVGAMLLAGGVGIFRLQRPAKAKAQDACSVSSIQGSYGYQYN